MESLRFIPLHEVPSIDKKGKKNGTRHGSKTCEARGCSERTKEGKPYCILHLDQHPYAAGVIHTLREEADEIARVAKFGVKAVSPEGNTAKRILHVLKHEGERTHSRLARETNLDRPILDCYLTVLARKGLIVISQTQRQVLTAKLPSTP